MSAENPQAISDPAAIERHFERLKNPLCVRLVREPDWNTLRGLLSLRSEEPAENTHPSTLKIATTRSVSPCWEGQPAFVSFPDNGTWSYRTVVRAVDGVNVFVDPPNELRPCDPPTPYQGRIAEATDKQAEHGFIELELVEFKDNVARSIYGQIAGGDLHMRDRQGSLINHPGRVSEVIDRVARQELVAIIKNQEHEVFGARIWRESVQGKKILRVAFKGRVPENLKVGGSVCVSTLLGDAVYTGRLEVSGLTDDGLVSAEPKEFVRAQRRSAPRFQIEMATPEGVKVHARDDVSQTFTFEGIVDLSDTGCSLFTDKRPPFVPQSTVVINLDLSSGQALRLPALVATETFHAERLRMGFEFLDLPERSLRVLRQIIKRYGRIVANPH